MINKTLKLTFLLAFITTFLNSTHAFASTFDVTASVLKFQTKMAERGSVESQYKLGFMYETGSGTEQNIDKAIHWYKKASKKRYQPATNRITYLKLKNTGMKHEYIRWLINLKASAQANDKDALFLLGQMYAEGTGVNKSLTRSLELLHKARRKNVVSADSYIAQIESELAALKKKYASPLTNENAKEPSSSVSKPASLNKSSGSNKKPATTKSKIKPQATSVQKSRKVIKQKPLKSLKTSSSHVQKSIKKITRIANTETTPEPQYRHPMETICGGNNHFMSGCR